jgi:hypothetical protein
MESHQIHPELLRHKVRILVVGCGGNGSAIAPVCRTCTRHCSCMATRKAARHVARPRRDLPDELCSSALQPIGDRIVQIGRSGQPPKSVLGIGLGRDFRTSRRQTEDNRCRYRDRLCRHADRAGRHCKVRRRLERGRLLVGLGQQCG